MPFRTWWGTVKGKSAIYIARNFVSSRRNFGGEKFWARAYYVSMVDGDEATIRENIKKQEEEDRWLDQMNLFLERHLQVAQGVQPL